jgi:hypothetical protein
MKMKLNWHKECLKNVKQYRDRQKSVVREAEEALERIETKILIMELQIDEAERKGLDAFDADRFMVRRKSA